MEIEKRMERVNIENLYYTHKFERIGLAKRLKEILNNKILTEQERKCLVFRYYQGFTLNQIGEEIGVSRERVRCVIAKALRKLKHPAISKILRDYLEE